jgi:hypothetical protein
MKLANVAEMVNQRHHGDRVSRSHMSVVRHSRRKIARNAAWRKVPGVESSGLCSLKQIAKSDFSRPSCRTFWVFRSVLELLKICVSFDVQLHEIEKLLRTIPSVEAASDFLSSFFLRLRLLLISIGISDLGSQIGVPVARQRGATLGAQYNEAPKCRFGCIDTAVTGCTQASMIKYPINRLGLPKEQPVESPQLSVLTMAARRAAARSQSARRKALPLRRRSLPRCGAKHGGRGAGRGGDGRTGYSRAAGAIGPAA